MAAVQLHHHHHYLHHRLVSHSSLSSAVSLRSICNASGSLDGNGGGVSRRRGRYCFKGNAAVLFDPLRRWSGRRRVTPGGGRRRPAVSCCSTTTTGRGWWEEWWGVPPSASSTAVSLSDVLWPSAGAFVAMALLGRLDQMMARKGLSITVAPLGAVCAVLFATPTAPGARKYNMFMAQIGCAAFGVSALLIFGPGWLARSTALAASIAFMIITRAIHPPAASLPILFIDGAKFHQLHFWYALFPGATGCILLCLIQEIVSYLKVNYKF